MRSAELIMQYTPFADIDATLEALRHTLGHFDVVKEEEPKIQQG